MGATISNAAQAYDSHCNLVLGEVEETIYVVEDEDEDDEEVKVRGRDVVPCCGSAANDENRRSAASRQCCS